MLVIMEHWNVHQLLELLLHIKAVWTLDVLKINTGETRTKILDTIDELVFILGVYTNVHGINPSEFVEEN